MDTAADRVDHHDAEPQPERSVNHVVEIRSNGVANRVEREAEESRDAVENPSSSVDLETFVDEHVLNCLRLSVDEKQVVNSTDGAQACASKHGSGRPWRRRCNLAQDAPHGNEDVAQHYHRGRDEEYDWTRLNHAQTNEARDEEQKTGREIDRGKDNVANFVTISVSRIAAVVDSGRRVAPISGGQCNQVPRCCGGIHSQ